MRKAFIVCLVIALLLWPLPSFASTEILRPTSQIDGGVLGNGCFGSNSAAPSYPNAIDAAGLSTSSGGTITGTATLTKYYTRVFKVWATPTHGYSLLTLNINSGSNGWSFDSSPGTGTGVAVVNYSIDSGVTWNVVRSDSGAGWAQITDTITLSTSQDFTKLQVSICVEGDQGINPNFGTDDMTVWDIWTSGSFNAGKNQGVIVGN